MAKYLVEAKYTSEGLRGLLKDKASGRKAAVSSALESMGGKVESFYFTFGNNDVIVICDMPDNVSAAALSLSASSTGLVRTRTTPMLSVEEADAAIGKGAKYRGPGA
jgi:uncharacterized protein with GYD domain